MEFLHDALSRDHSRAFGTSCAPWCPSFETATLTLFTLFQLLMGANWSPLLVCPPRPPPKAIAALCSLSRLPSAGRGDAQLRQPHRPRTLLPVVYCALPCLYALAARRSRARGVRRRDGQGCAQRGRRQDDYGTCLPRPTFRLPARSSPPPPFHNRPLRLAPSFSWSRRRAARTMPPLGSPARPL